MLNANAELVNVTVPPTNEALDATILLALMVAGHETTLSVTRKVLDEE